MTRHWPGMAVTLLALALFPAPAMADNGTFSTASPLSLSGGGQAGPSAVSVSGMSGSLASATVTLSGVTVATGHLDILLVAPHGETVLLESDVPVNASGAGATWTYSDEGGTQTTGADGTYKPTNADGGLGDTDAFSAPAPVGPLYGSHMADLDGPNPNGSWQLYIRDPGAAPVTIGGWSLQLGTTPDVSPGSKAFADTRTGNTSSAQIFTVTNSGNAPVQISAAQLQGADPGQFAVTVDGCAGTVLDVGTNCTIQAAFKPTSAGAKTALLFIGDDTGTGGHSLPLTGTATEPAVSVSPSSIDFGTTTLGGRYPSQLVTVTNTGTADLSFSKAAEPVGTDIGQFMVTESRCSRLAPGASCTFKVSFIPFNEGVKSSSIQFSDNAPGSPHAIAVTGTAIADPTPRFIPAPPNESSGSPELRIDSATFQQTGPLTAGQPTQLRIVASDPNRAVTGVMVDFDEALGLFAESACVEGVNKGNSTTFRIPYEFVAPGPHRVTVTVFAGGCGSAISHTLKFSVDVRPATAAFRVGARASDTIDGPPITSRCKDARLAPALANAKRVVKALLCVMNEQRKLAKLKPFKLSKRLTKAALAHSKAMVTGKFFAHQGPAEAPLVKRLQKVRYRGAGAENIGAGAGSLGTPLGMVDGWMHSTAHRANLLSRQWKTVGIGFLPQFPLATPATPVSTFTTDFGTKP